MRVNGRNISRDTTPDKNIGSPTPVIVSLGPRVSDTVIKSPENAYNIPPRPVRSPLFYRSTVISPNPERLLYSTIQHPSVILNAANFALMQDQPMDFSTSGRENFDRQNNERNSSYAVKLAIAV